MSFIEIYGAREHNLKNINIKIPHYKLTVITGLSGSGKSSLAFDTIYAEGQRRYLETFNAYARQFIGTFKKTDVDKIIGLSPVIAIEQKTVNKNPRSTVGTITEIYDFLRLWFAKSSDAYSYITGEKMIKYTDEQIIELVKTKFKKQKILILSPVVKSRKGHYKELFSKFFKLGFHQARIDGKITEFSQETKLQRYKTHNIEIVIDKIIVPENNTQQGGIKRLKNSINLAMKYGKGTIIIMEKDTEKIHYFSRKLVCPTSGISYEEPAPNTFSFNSPQGYCPQCKGLGYIKKIDIKKIIPDNQKSIYNGAIKPLGKYRSNILFWQIEEILQIDGYDIKTPIKNLPSKTLNKILYGSDEQLRLSNTPLGNMAKFYTKFDGIINELLYGTLAETGENLKNFMYEEKCPVCNGARLKKESLHFRINNKSIAELSQMDLKELYDWLENVEQHLNNKQKQISKEILKEIRYRLKFLIDIGLGYLTLDRTAASLSGGEAQRIRLATQISSQLVNVLYILDEPSIGLHARDNIRLINSLKKLRDEQNTIIVVEHDAEIMKQADYLIDIGPGAGRCGGQIVAHGTLQKILQSNSLTAQYLTRKKQIPIPKNKRKGNGKFLTIHGARGNNLKNITVSFPLGKFICITGVSGSGKSTLINNTLYPILAQKLYNSKLIPLEYDKIEGIENINKVIVVDQSPIGRTPRSNPATYTKVFTHIRQIFAQTPIAKIRGYKPNIFSFNVKGGRCEECKGAGVKTIEMKLIPDVHITCNVCAGKRYTEEALEVRYKGKSIADVLDMTINQAIEFFENHPKILNILKALADVGLGYIKLGQSSTTLSGGEAQRIKLASELAKKSTGNTMYILDEPTTGMHFDDILKLLNVLHRLADRGNTIIVIEHNMDVIKNADWIIDLGPEGGAEGGLIVCQGPPEVIINCKEGWTYKFLKEVFKK